MGPIAAGRFLLKWLVLGGIVGMLTGSAAALFLAALDRATDARLSHPWLLLFLPLGGAVVSYLYGKIGGDSSKGNNLILDQIHGGEGRVPLRMAPLVLFGTVVTHLFGGSVGREGTAVQMGGSLAEGLGTVVRLNAADRRLILMCGIASGFGAVFGTPLAGAMFGMEVLAIGLLRSEGLVPCLIASLVGDIVTRAWGIQHHLYQVSEVPAITGPVMLKVAVASVAFGLAGLLFSESTRWLKALYTKLIPYAPLKSFVGGLVIIALVYIGGTRDYLGLGLPLIEEAFKGDAPTFAFLWKSLYTSLSLGAGFQGGEVTPLFVIGSTLGSTLAGLLQVSVPFLAALGFVAVFSGAANTPIACFIMGVELFGAGFLPYLFIACAVSYLFSGHTGIYLSQRIGTAKTTGIDIPENSTLSFVRQKKR
ncbi:voltage-gated chloride channel family protein [Gorillibacterium timonense]|uniref:voltage-gated chloride channel family protein n=1 Tax=Gorillibacterium timonense TaxID=1689269 RepID=UPI00071D184F|nr:voltage-gated chloride channel family protein [Gorillibacterium timonense]